MRILPIILCLVTLSLVSMGQISQIIPVFPKQDEAITIIFDAKELGSTAMLGASKVYIHSSIGTDPNQFTWTGQYTIGNWGLDDGVGEMNSLGNDVWSISFIPDVYYNIPPNITAYNLAMVFRNGDGSAEGKNDDGSDIFSPLFGAGHSAQLLSPVTNSVLNFSNLNLNDTIEVIGVSSDTSSLELYANDTLIAQSLGDSINFKTILTKAGLVRFQLNSTTPIDTAADSVVVFVLNPTTVLDPPAGTHPGLNIINDSTVILALVAPGKSSAIIQGGFNNWLPDPSYQMNLSVDGDLWWGQISGLDKNVEYVYQYLVDGKILVPDPYTEKVLDQFNDPFIPASTYPGLIDFPSSKTGGRASTFIINETNYSWVNSSFSKPDKANLVIYELLIRDFIATHDYSTLIDTLDYLQHLGINAIELMPVNEFEGNESWGYNPSFYFAPDKYYGTKNDLKQFIDECHGRGIAVIVDVVLNHSFSQSPFVKLYWDGSKPSTDNPWYNQTAKHDFNVGYDFNHESIYTKRLVSDVVKFWIQEYNVDGYRFDLSKGFTQNNTLGNSSAMAAYDQSRIDILKNIADTIWSIDPDFYVILEHFANNSEEKELSDYGMMLWGNANHAAAEATMGFVSTSDLSWGLDYQERNWNNPNLVSYMESHDEERLMYKNKKWGNISGSYSTRAKSVGLARIEAAATIFLTVPGPKMIWQFGEQGYDISIDDPCRVCNKPIKWDYLQDDNRKRLYEVYSTLINLRLSEDAFTTTNYSTKLNGAIKRVTLNHASMDVVATANFDVSSSSTTGTFPHTGTWYEYFSGDTLQVNTTDYQVNFEPGQYYLFTTKKFDAPELPVGIYTPSDSKIDDVTVFPNPNRGDFFISVNMKESSTVVFKLIDILGNELESREEFLNTGFHQLEFYNKNLASGNYILQITSGNNTVAKKLTVTD